MALTITPLPLARHEQFLASKLQELGLYDGLDDLMQARADMWYVVVRDQLKPPDLSHTSILDLGGGSGEFGEVIQNATGWEVTIADAMDWRKVDVPFVPVIAHQLGVPDKSFDQTLVMTVLHHAVDPVALLTEAIRVTRRRLIFVESVPGNQLPFLYVAWIDWFYNHVVHFTPEIKNKINVPCNFLPTSAWEDLVWKICERSPTVSRSLGVFQHLNPEPHHLFVYDLM